MKKPILFFLLILIISCRQNNNTEKPQKSVFIDSTLIIFDFAANTVINDLNSKKAKFILNTHFKKKGCLIESELNFETYNPEAPENYGKRAIDFLEIQKVDNRATIVKYYNCEPFLNGTCVLPHYAIIANTTKGNKIIHEDFLPNNFVIDSVKKEEKGIFIYGYFYECANKKNLRSYKIEMK